MSQTLDERFIGGDFDAFLAEEGLLAEAEAVAVKARRNFERNLELERAN